MAALRLRALGLGQERQHEAAAHLVAPGHLELWILPCAGAEHGVMPILRPLPRDVGPCPALRLSRHLVLEAVQHLAQEVARFRLLYGEAVQIDDGGEDLVVWVVPSALACELVPEVAALLVVNLETPTIRQASQKHSGQGVEEGPLAHGVNAQKQGILGLPICRLADRNFVRRNHYRIGLRGRRRSMRRLELSPR